MKLLTFLLILSIGSCFSQNCHIPGDGIYEIKYENIPADTPKYKMRIAGEKIYFTEETGEKENEIEKLDDCGFKLKHRVKVDETKLTEVQKILYNQPIWFQIEKVEGTIYHFTLFAGLNIIGGHGTFTKID